MPPPWWPRPRGRDREHAVCLSILYFEAHAAQTRVSDTHPGCPANPAPSCPESCTPGPDRKEWPARGPLGNQLQSHGHPQNRGHQGFGSAQKSHIKVPGTHHRDSGEKQPQNGLWVPVTACCWNSPGEPGAPPAASSVGHPGHFSRYELRGLQVGLPPTRLLY